MKYKAQYNFKKAPKFVGNKYYIWFEDKKAYLCELETGYFTICFTCDSAMILDDEEKAIELQEKFQTKGYNAETLCMAIFE